MCIRDRPFIVHDHAGKVAFTLGADRHLLAPRCGPVVVISQQPDLEGVPTAVAPILVKPQHVGLVFVHQLHIFGNPGFQKFRAGGVAAVGDAVESGPGGIILVAAGKGGDKIEMRIAMIGNPRFQPHFAHGREQITNQVAFGAHVFGVVFIDGAIPIGKAVMMSVSYTHLDVYKRQDQRYGRELAPT